MSRRVGRTKHTDVPGIKEGEYDSNSKYVVVLVQDRHTQSLQVVRVGSTYQQLL